MKRRFLILTEGQTHPTPAKLAAGILRYRIDEVVALLDSCQAGKDTGDLMGVGHGIPIISCIQDASSFKPDTFLIGITPAGGELPKKWRSLIKDAIKHRMDIVSGMHTFLNDDPQLVKLARKYQVKLVDLREVPPDLTVNTCQAQKSHSYRIHTVGTDCNCGKKITALEINHKLRQSGKKSTFIATGQTGILISEKGIAMDHVISDFVSGAAERLVLENADYDFLVIEGQGSIIHPLYSGVTLSMLHGFAPQALILCHQFDRTILRGTPNTPVPSLKNILNLYEDLSKPVFPSKVIAISLNMNSLPRDKAREEIKKIEQEFGLPATDVVQFGPDKLVDAILNHKTHI